MTSAEGLVQRVGDRFIVSTATVVLEFAHLRDHSEGLAAELAIYRVATGTRHWGRLTLSSTQARAAQVKALERTGPIPGLADLLDEACYQVTRLVRAGLPSAPLVRAMPSPDAWFLPGLFPLGETSILYGDGASAKSLLALALAMAGLTREPLGRSEKWRVAPLDGVLYLDWESRMQDHAERLWGLTRMHGTGEEVKGIRYRAMTRGLADELSAVSQECATEPTDLIIVDSLGAASGAEPEGADAAVRTMNALRTLAPATRLVIAHVSKAAADVDKGTPKPYGSVYVSNLARSTVLAVAADQIDADELLVTYNHSKVNRGPIVSARALRFAFDAGEIAISAVEPDLGRSGLSVQIINALRGGSQTVTTLSEELDVSEGSLRKVLSRLENRDRVIRLVSSDGGRGQKSLWGLRHENRDTQYRDA
jgi:hypothetical protein